MNDPLALTNGFIIKQDAVIDNENKSRFQSLHSDFLSQPKKTWQKYDTVQNSIDHEVSFDARENKK